MGWAVALDKEDLIGRDALLKVRLEGPTRTLVGFRMTEGGVARHGYPIATPDGQVVGEVTSGSYAPTLNTFIGLGFVPVALAKPGTEICIDIRGKLRRRRAPAVLQAALPPLKGAPAGPLQPRPTEPALLIARLAPRSGAREPARCFGRDRLRAKVCDLGTA